MNIAMIASSLKPKCGDKWNRIKYKVAKVIVIASLFILLYLIVERPFKKTVAINLPNKDLWSNANFDLLKKKNL